MHCRPARIAAFLVCMTVTLCMGGVPHSSEPPSGPPENLMVFLLIGQSNMAGRAPIEGGDAGTIDRCWLLNHEGVWEPAASPLNRYSPHRKEMSMQRMGPGDYFARTFLDARPGAAIGLVVNARGGTKIEQWSRDGRLYYEAVRRTRKALENGVLAGILWHQGEGNRDDADYLEKLKDLITDLRSDLNAPELPFVAGEITGEWPVNDQLEKLPETVPHTAVAGVEGLVTFDRRHFDTPSMRELGRRYARAMILVLER